MQEVDFQHYMFMILEIQCDRNFAIKCLRIGWSSQKFFDSNELTGTLMCSRGNYTVATSGYRFANNVRPDPPLTDGRSRRNYGRRIRMDSQEEAFKKNLEKIFVGLIALNIFKTVR